MKISNCFRGHIHVSRLFAACWMCALSSLSKDKCSLWRNNLFLPVSRIADAIYGSIKLRMLTLYITASMKHITIALWWQASKPGRIYKNRYHLSGFVRRWTRFRRAKACVDVEEPFKYGSSLETFSETHPSTKIRQFSSEMHMPFNTRSLPCKLGGSVCDGICNSFVVNPILRYYE